MIKLNKKEKAENDLVMSKGRNMYKVSRFLRKLPSDKPEAFSEHWINVYGTAFKKLAASNPGLIRYAQNYRKIDADSPFGNAVTNELDVIDELWFENKSAADALFSSKEYQETVLPIQEKYIDAKRSEVVTGDVHIVWSGSAAPKEDKVKIVFQSFRRPDLTFEEYRHHWLNNHAALTREMPDADKISQRSEFLPTERCDYSGLQAADCDGSGAVWFVSLKELQASFETPYYHEVLAPDEKRFSDGSRYLGHSGDEVVILTSPKW